MRRVFRDTLETALAPLASFDRVKPFLRRRLTSLFGHVVRDSQNPLSANIYRYPTTAEFRRTLDFLRENFQFVDLATVVAHYRDGAPLPDYPLFLSFDDGFRETAEVIEGTDGASYPFWSPDGRHIGFFADRMLKRVPAEGGAVLTLAEAPFGKGGGWNEDGQIVFTPSYNTALHVVSQDGDTTRPLTELDTASGENSHRFPSYLPDGRRLLRR